MEAGNAASVVSMGPSCAPASDPVVPGAGHPAGQVCVCVCVCVCVHVYIHIQIYAYDMCICRYGYCIYMYIYVHVYIHICVCTYIESLESAALFFVLCDLKFFLDSFLV